jgi:hypothetical protein
MLERRQRKHELENFKERDCLGNISRWILEDNIKMNLREYVMKMCGYFLMVVGFCYQDYQLPSVP